MHVGRYIGLRSIPGATTRHARTRRSPSSHSNEDLIVFENEQDAPHEGVIVTARAFAKAIEATDDPPLFVLLNSCKSAVQIDDLVARVVPFAIGMADSIDDGDAINYAA